MDCSENEHTIKLGDYVVVERQGYTKLHKVKAHSKLILGSFNIEMDNVIGEKYFDTFQMKTKADNKKFYLLEKVVEVNSPSDLLNKETSGVDNRHIPNNADSQNLTRDDIDKLKQEEFSSNTIVEQLITNSKTFNMKTEYSQEKYIKKKEKKYFEYVQIQKPTIRILAQMFYRQEPSKTLGMNIDDLSQILCYANIHQEGNHLLYDSGTSGLMPAAVTNAIGANTPGHLVHMHQGNECQKNAFIAMQFPLEQSQRCINVNIYSALRTFYQDPKYAANIDDGPSAKKAKLEEPVEKKIWEKENEKACEILVNKVDSLIITAKQHPVNIAQALLPFLNGNRNVVVFSLVREPLLDLYGYLKSRTDIAYIQLFSNFMRNYQILPERTHPEVNMPSGGYILTALKLIED